MFKPKKSRCQPLVMQDGECLCLTTPAPFVLDGDGFQQHGGATVMEVLRRTDLGKMHAVLPMGDQTMRLVCSVALAGLECLSRER